MIPVLAVLQRRIRLLVHRPVVRPWLIPVLVCLSAGFPLVVFLLPSLSLVILRRRIRLLVHRPVLIRLWLVPALVRLLVLILVPPPGRWTRPAVRPRVLTQPCLVRRRELLLVATRRHPLPVNLLPALG